MELAVKGDTFDVDMEVNAGVAGVALDVTGEEESGGTGLGGDAIDVDAIGGEDKKTFDVLKAIGEMHGETAGPCMSASTRNQRGWGLSIDR